MAVHCSSSTHRLHCRTLGVLRFLCQDPNGVERRVEQFSADVVLEPGCCPASDGTVQSFRAATNNHGEDLRR